MKNQHLMEHTMANPTLEGALQTYGHEALLLTVGEGGPHTCVVQVELNERTIKCIPSQSAARNIRGEANVSLVWPAIENGGYAIIANGLTDLSDDPAGFSRAEIKLTKSVFHRAGPRPEGRDGPCPSDCIELT